MPDIRVTPQLDDFSSFADENPVSHSGRWQGLGGGVPEMQKLTDGGPTSARITRGATGTGFTYAWAGWAATGPFDGDVEIWGQRYEGGYEIGHNERLGLMTSITAGVVNGYQVWFHQTAGAHRYYLFRYASGIRTELTNVEADENLVLMRRNGNFVEVWDADVTDPTTWTMRIQVTDTTYTTGLYLTFGEGTNFSSDSSLTGWQFSGGGIESDTFQQIIRRVIG